MLSQNLFSWVKPVHVGFSSSIFIVQDHILSSPKPSKHQEDQAGMQISKDTMYQDKAGMFKSLYWTNTCKLGMIIPRTLGVQDKL
jgi:hypothetical protein